VHIVCNVLPRSLCGWPRKFLHLLEEGLTNPIVRFAYLCHMIGEEFVFLFFLYIKLFELGLEVAFNNRSAVTHRKVNLLEFPLRSSCSERTDDAFVLLICFCFFHLHKPLLPFCQPFKFKDIYDLHILIDCDPI